MRHRVAIQSATTTQDEFNDVVISEDDWTTDVTVWAEVRAMSGRELWNAQQVQPDITHTVVMRYRSGVTSANRLVFDSRNLNIQSVITDPKKTTLTMTCVERV